MAAFYDMQKRDRSINETIDQDYYHSRVRKNDGSIDYPRNVGLNFPADFEDPGLVKRNK
jgi:hypothetical protein